MAEQNYERKRESKDMSSTHTSDADQLMMTPSLFPSRGYIEASEDGIVRLDQKTDKNVCGLYTKGLQNCLAIVIHNKEAGRISLMHKTWAMNSLDVIINEMCWVASGQYELNSISALNFNVVYRGKIHQNLKDCEVLVYYNDHYGDDELWKKRLEQNRSDVESGFTEYFKLETFLLKSHAVKFLPTSKEGWVAIDRECNIRKLNVSGLFAELELYSHPQARKHFIISRLNNYVYANQEDQDDVLFKVTEIEFDGSKWSSKLPTLRLEMAAIEQIMRQGGMTGEFHADQYKLLCELREESQPSISRLLSTSHSKKRKFSDDPEQRKVDGEQLSSGSEIIKRSASLNPGASAYSSSSTMFSPRRTSTSYSSSSSSSAHAFSSQRSAEQPEEEAIEGAVISGETTTQMPGAESDQGSRAEAASSKIF